MNSPLPTRQRLIDAMCDSLQRRGLHASGLTELLAAADAPKGVLYHHFPGGKSELAVAAIDATVARLCANLDAKLAAAQDPATALLAWIDGAVRRLDASAYERGCPLATIALESTAADGPIRAALAAAFDQIRARIGAALAASGHPPAQAAALAALIVAAYEGGLLQARVAGSATPMTLVSQALLTLLHPPGEST